MRSDAGPGSEGQAPQPDSTEPEVSVIVPVGPGETGTFPLLAQLGLLPSRWQVVLALCEPRDDLLNRIGRRVYTVISSAGRAAQMNRAATVASGRWLWFLHLDSELTPAMIDALEQSIARGHPALLYFRLGFAADGAGPTHLNALGANLRSGWLGVPFGDQGLCLPAQAFRQLGGYSEKARYGEDHLLVWRARQAGIALRELDVVLVTSARQYRRRGWLSLTLLYQWRWLRQAFPEWLRLLAGRQGPG